MKKLLLVSAIVLGSYSIASAQAADVAQPAQSKQTATTNKLATKRQTELAAEQTATTSKRPVSNVAAKQKAVARKAKPATAAKKD